MARTVRGIMGPILVPRTSMWLVATERADTRRRKMIPWSVPTEMMSLSPSKVRAPTAPIPSPNVTERILWSVTSI